MVQKDYTIVDTQKLVIERVIRDRQDEQKVTTTPLNCRNIDKTDFSCNNEVDNKRISEVIMF